MKRHAWNILQEQLRRINEDIALKENSMLLEKRALANRKRLGNFTKPETETDKNLILSGVILKYNKIITLSIKQPF